MFSGIDAATQGRLTSIPQNTMADPNFNAQEVFQFAIQLAKEAGQTIREGRQKLRDDIANDQSDILKKNTADLVTETDKATEELVKGKIAKTYPHHQFIGEESWAAGQENKIGDAPTWICDPIDGTTNFVHNFPFCCISIALTHKQELVFGVVYAPFLDRLYTGLKGHGSHLITPSSSGTPQKLPLQDPLPLPTLRQALIALEWGSDRRTHIASAKARAMEKLCSEDGKMVQGIRSIGSAAMTCCFVAEGSLDLYQEISCYAWDVAAGWLIANEAGGLTVGSKDHTLSLIESDSPELGKVTPEILQGRKYCTVRAIGDHPSSGSGREQQKGLLKEFFSAIDEWEVS